jgi:hypothetical protein
MGESDLGLLFEQMSELLNGVRNLHEAIELRQAKSEQLQDLVRSELTVLLRDQRELEDKVDCMAFVIQHDVNALRARTVDNTRSIDDMVNAVESLRKPITDIVLLKSRIAGLIFGLGLVGSVVLWLAEPVYRWFVDAKLMRHLGG